MTRYSVIYCITNLINNKKYVGSAGNIEQRWNSHRNTLRLNRHRSARLQNSWNKYGESVFEFKILEEVSDKTKLIEREQYWIDFYKSYLPENGYNIRSKAESNRGVKFGVHTTDHNFKISQSLLSRNLRRSNEHVKAIKDSKLGKPRSQETKNKISLAMTGKNLGRIPWNKGLDKTDPRVAKNYINRSKKYA